MKEIESMMWDGYCPESKLKGKHVKMRHNNHDFFESEETGLQISLVPGVQAVILNFRGKGEFRQTARYGHDEETGELLSPQNRPRAPFNYPVEVFKNMEEVKSYIEKIY